MRSLLGAAASSGGCDIMPTGTATSGVPGVPSASNLTLAIGDMPLRASAVTNIGGDAPTTNAGAAAPIATGVMSCVEITLFSGSSRTSVDRIGVEPTVYAINAPRLAYVTAGANRVS